MTYILWPFNHDAGLYTCITNRQVKYFKKVVIQGLCVFRTSQSHFQQKINYFAGKSCHAYIFNNKTNQLQINLLHQYFSKINIKLKEELCCMIKHFHHTL